MLYMIIRNVQFYMIIFVAYEREMYSSDIQNESIQQGFRGDIAGRGQKFTQLFHNIKNQKTNIKLCSRLCSGGTVKNWFVWFAR